MIIGSIDLAANRSFVDNVIAVKDTVKSIFGDYPVKELGINRHESQFICNMYRYENGRKIPVNNFTVTVVDIIEFTILPDDMVTLKFKFTYDGVNAKDYRIDNAIRVPSVTLTRVFVHKNMLAIIYTGDPNECVNYIKLNLGTFNFSDKFYKRYKIYSCVMNKNINNSIATIYHGVACIAYTGTELPPTKELKDFIQAVLGENVKL